MLSQFQQLRYSQSHQDQHDRHHDQQFDQRKTLFRALFCASQSSAFMVFIIPRQSWLISEITPNKLYQHIVLAGQIFSLDLHRAEISQ